MEHGWNEDEALPPEGAQVFSPETMVTSDRDGCIIYLLDRAKRNKEKEVKKKKPKSRQQQMKELLGFIKYQSPF